MPIRVLIADDHAIVAEGLRHLIDAQPDMQTIACVENGSEAVRVALKVRPDVVLMDNAMPVMNGTEATRVIREHRPEIRIIILSMYSDHVHVYRALHAGAAGYLIKRSLAGDVHEAIRAVYRGERHVSAPLVTKLIDQLMSEPPLEDPLARLSARERQVLQLVAEGQPTARIAEILTLSPRTVETYRSRLMEKLGIHDLAGLIRFAIQQGISSLD